MSAGGNDALRAAFPRGAALADRRLICSQDTDYANPIEPSAQGGQKVAQAIAALVRPAHAGPHSVVVAQ